MILFRWRMGGLGYGASKPNIVNRVWGIIDTSKKDGEYITERRHLPSRSDGLFLFRWCGGGRSDEEEHWDSRLTLCRIFFFFFFFPTMVHLIPHAVSYTECHALFQRFCTGGSLFCTLRVSSPGLMGKISPDAEQEHRNTCCCTFKDMSHLVILGSGKNWKTIKPNTKVKLWVILCIGVSSTGRVQVPHSEKTRLTEHDCVWRNLHSNNLVIYCFLCN